MYRYTHIYRYIETRRYVFYHMYPEPSLVSEVAQAVLVELGALFGRSPVGAQVLLAQAGSLLPGPLE